MTEQSSLWSSVHMVKHQDAFGKSINRQDLCFVIFFPSIPNSRVNSILFIFEIVI